MITAKMREITATYVAIHSEILFDIRRFLSVGDKWDKLDKRTFDKLHDYFKFHAQNVNIHNHASDEHFFPIFAKRMPELELGPLIEERNAERQQIKKKLEEIDKLFTTNPGKLQGAFEDYQSYVEAHFDTEETKIMVPAVKQLTRETAIALEKEFLKELSKEETQLNFPWFLDGMDEKSRASFFKEKVPFFVPWFYSWFMRPRFQKKVAVFRQFEAS